MSSPLKEKVWGIRYSKCELVGDITSPAGNRNFFLLISLSRMLNEKEGFNIERFAVLGKEVAIQ